MMRLSFLRRGISTRRPLYRYAILAAAVLSCVLVPEATATAQPSLLKPTSAQGELVCEPTARCGADAGVCEGDLLCTESPLDTDGKACAYTEKFRRDVQCCLTGQNACGERNDVNGLCLSLPNREQGVCIYPGEFDSCLSVDSTLDANLTQLRKCFRSADTNDLQAKWHNGDCDGDGFANGEDCCPCDPDRTCGADVARECKRDLPDAGVGADAGMNGDAAIPPDAGLGNDAGVIRDAGPRDAAPPVDAAPGPEDAGAASDASPPGDDAGARIDAATGLDAGGAPANPGVQITGEGGCRAASAGGDDHGARASAALLAVALLSRRRLRRR